MLSVMNNITLKHKHCSGQKWQLTRSPKWTRGENLSGIHHLCKDQTEPIFIHQIEEIHHPVAGSTVKRWNRTLTGSGLH